MKTRDGFVSNSSSSSFILGLARIVDLNDVRKFGTDDNDDFEVIRFGDGNEHRLHECDEDVGSGTVILTSYGEGDTKLTDMKPGDLYLAYKYTYWMCGSDDFGEINYEWFNEPERKCIDFLRTSTALSDAKVNFGFVSC